MKNNLLLGQHFLVCDKVVQEMIDLSEINKNDKILEIGAGNGVVSKKIAPLCKSLQIVEIDINLKPYLDEVVSRFSNVQVEYNNALKYDFSHFDKIITSLPYNILEPFLFKCIKQKTKLIVMLIGDKYALSLKDENFNNNITITQLLTKTFFNCTVSSFVSKNCFEPKPRTGSFIVKLTKKDSLSSLDFIIAEIFMQSDKKIKTALKEAIIRYNLTQNKIKTQKQAKQIIDNMNIHENVLNVYFSNATNQQMRILYNAIKNNLKLIEE